jgi:hypothetical protein
MGVTCMCLITVSRSSQQGAVRHYALVLLEFFSFTLLKWDTIYMSWVDGPGRFDNSITSTVSY